ncbi:maleylpyruvate isomerase family mycothiol-dependent enzyme [Dietzia alimentaria]|uniref:maleylpyruvate isomerase family mycothiol-dependent enzyme n=1 Tax=Dietzia alimentaria TaxID=665550 RepID=UPI00029A09A4|nr:maleylpyruvate isomerase family mycothiol-dependent enzyme [Dietzia alimentaria]
MIGRLTRDRMLDALEAQVGLIRYALVGDGSGPEVDLATPVPSCPDWTVHDLVAHIGTANWWGGANVRDANPDARARGMRAVMESAPPATEGAAALAGWYADLAVDALEIYTDGDPDDPAWTFAGPGRAGYWMRRQLHETVIHRWDLEKALQGSSGTTPLSEDVAVDTVDEFCTSMRPLMALLSGELPATLRVRAMLQAPEGLASGAEPVGALDPGSDLEWVLPGADGAPEAVVTGPPETLALLLWGRVDADAPGLEVTGDRAALDAVLEAGLTA